jgi:hypothetical protein
MMKKTLTLISLMLAAPLASVAAQAKTFHVACALPEGQNIVANFTASGSVTVEENGDSSAALTLQINGLHPAMPAVSEFFNGKTQTIPPGYMPQVSYGFVGTAEHIIGDEDGKPAIVRIFLGGPKNQASSRVILNGAEYLSNCDIVP